MTIREAKKEDLDVIYRLVSELEQVSFEVEIFSAVYLRNLGNSCIKYFLSEHHGEVSGFISVYIQELLHHCAPVAEIQELCVFPQFRNRQTGKALLEHAVQYARSKDCELMEVACNRRREEAHRFYLANGFSATHFKFTLPLK